MYGTQWIFLALYNAGLAYKALAPVNWCPGCQTVLANEQVIDGRCDRSGDLVVRRELEQWYFRITDYAQQLLDDLGTLDWPEKVLTQQRNWIGRSEGAEFEMVVCNADGTDRADGLSFRVYTTRPDTSFGMTFCVLAPEHPLVASITTDDRVADVAAFIEQARNTSEIDRLSTERPLESRGSFTGAYARNPFNGAAVPIYLADYVLGSYGTGAVMAVPGQDQRDWEFATVFGLPIVRTVQPPDEFDGEAYVGDGPHINSASPVSLDIDGLDVPTAKDATIALARAAVDRRAEGQLPPARLAGLPPALLGLSDPDRLLRRRLWCAAGSRRPAPRGRPRRRGVRADRAVPAASTTRGSSTRPVPTAAARPVARPTPWTPSSTARGTSCGSVIPG